MGTATAMQERRDRLWKAAQGPRDPRSPEYMAGIKTTLEWLAGPRDTRLANPHKGGTAQADAWTAGNREAHQRWGWDEDHGGAR